MRLKITLKNRSAVKGGQSHCIITANCSYKAVAPTLIENHKKHFQFINSFGTSLSTSMFQSYHSQRNGNSVVGHRKCTRVIKEHSGIWTNNNTVDLFFFSSQLLCFRATVHSETETVLRVSKSLHVLIKE